MSHVEYLEKLLEKYKEKEKNWTSMYNKMYWEGACYALRVVILRLKRGEETE